MEEGHGKKGHGRRARAGNEGARSWRWCRITFGADTPPPSCDNASEFQARFHLFGATEIPYFFKPIVDVICHVARNWCRMTFDAPPSTVTTHRKLKFCCPTSFRASVRLAKLNQGRLKIKISNFQTGADPNQMRCSHWFQIIFGGTRWQNAGSDQVFGERES